MADDDRIEAMNKLAEGTETLHKLNVAVGESWDALNQLAEAIGDSADELSIAHAMGPCCFRAGMEDIPPSNCCYCGHDTLYHDYCGMLCHTCGHDIDCSAAQLMHSLRRRAELSLEQVSELTGFAVNAIVEFEKNGPDDDYHAAFKQMIRNHYKGKP